MSGYLKNKKSNDTTIKKSRGSRIPFFQNRIFEISLFVFFLRVKALFIKEWVQAFRDPRLRFLIIGPPLMQLLAFGYAANLDLKNIRMALYDEDRSSFSRELATAFSSSGYFRFTEDVTDPRQMNAVMDYGRVDA
ncbi:MAG: hypothetical protein EHM45_20365, partial [Desulfobacteraceae bacterium]